MKKMEILSLMRVLAITLTACGDTGKDSSSSSSRESERQTSPSPTTNAPDNETAPRNFFAPEADEIEIEVEVSPFDGLEVAPESDFSYKFDSETGGMMITKYNGDMTRFRIPETIEDEPVTAIGERAFSGSLLTDISLPESLTFIGDGAFYGCSALTSITLPNGLTSIEAGTFRECRGLTNISLPNSLTTVRGGAFYGCTALTSLTLPDSVTKIENAEIPEFGRADIEYALFDTDIAVSYKGFVYNANEAVTAVALGEFGYQPIQYGGYNWFVLEKAGDKALIMSISIINANAWYSYYNLVNEDGEETWENTKIRQWLNEDFYYSINREDREKIAETLVTNNDNPWYGTSGGNDTTDKIFLLSVEEVVKYFGDSGQLDGVTYYEDWNGWLYPNAKTIDDEFNEARIAYDANGAGAAAEWGLRSPGGRGYGDTWITGVLPNGSIDVDGIGGTGNLRPAMWIYVDYDFSSYHSSASLYETTFIKSGGDNEH